MSTGEGFGEIALLGNATRTMTVRAVGPVELCVISSGAFLSAVTSISGARAAAEDDPVEPTWPTRPAPRSRSRIL